MADGLVESVFIGLAQTDGLHLVLLDDSHYGNLSLHRGPYNFIYIGPYMESRRQTICLVSLITLNVSPLDLPPFAPLPFQLFCVLMPL